MGWCRGGKVGGRAQAVWLTAKQVPGLAATARINNKL